MPTLPSLFLAASTAKLPYLHKFHGFDPEGFLHRRSVVSRNPPRREGKHPPEQSARGGCFCPGIHFDERPGERVTPVSRGVLIFHRLVTPVCLCDVDCKRFACSFLPMSPWLRGKMEEPRFAAAHSRFGCNSRLIHEF